MKSICIIPARGGSKRLPGKNKMDFDGQPMLTYPIRAAHLSELFSHIIISTDSEDIKNIVVMETPASYMMRADHLAGDDVNEIQVYLDVLRAHQEQYSELPEYFCAIYPTAVFLQFYEIVEAFELLKKSDADGCMGVTTYDIHPFRALGRDSEGHLYNLFPDENRTSSHDWPRACASNGTLYWFRTEHFMKFSTYFPTNLVGYETFAVDIDTRADYDRALACHRERKLRK